MFIEEVASGRLDLEANNETKDWTALFGAELNNAMGAKNSFRNVSDIVEFLKTLGYKINSGTFSLAGTNITSTATELKLYKKKDYLMFKKVVKLLMM